MDQYLCSHFLITGKVQGVWFRDSAKKEAERLGITGWAQNLMDGRVEVVACGEASQIDAFYEWLKYGPSMAEVDECIRESHPEENHDNFEVF